MNKPVVLVTSSTVSEQAQKLLRGEVFDARNFLNPAVFTAGQRAKLRE